LEIAGDKHEQSAETSLAVIQENICVRFAFHARTIKTFVEEKKYRVHPACQSSYLIDQI